MIEVGTTFASNEDGDAEVVKYVGSKEVHIRWKNTGNEEAVQLTNLRNGLFRDRKARGKVTAARLAKAAARTAAYQKTLEEARARDAKRQAEVLQRQTERDLRRQERLTAFNVRQAEREARELRTLSPEQFVEKLLTEPYQVKVEQAERKGVLEVDFKDRSGKWVLRFSRGGTDFVQTRLGKLHNNFTQRAKVGGSMQRKAECYVGTEISDEFLNAQTFCDWAVKQVGWGVGFQLDKDLLGGKAYSAETAIFLPAEVNAAIMRSKGVPVEVANKCIYLDIQANGISARVGPFESRDLAVAAYRRIRIAKVQGLAASYKPFLDPRAYSALMYWEP